MLREIEVVFGAVASIFLVIPLLWVLGGALSFVLPMVLFVIVLFYARFDVKKLRISKQYSTARYFILSLVLAVVLSFIVFYLIFPYVTPQLSI